MIRELHHDLDERRYGETIPQDAVREEGGIVAVAGVQKLTKLYYGRHSYVYDLSVTEGAWSKSRGERLLRHVEEAASREGCDYAALTCGREREDALRVYEDRMGYERSGYSKRMALPP